MGGRHPHGGAAPRPLLRGLDDGEADRPAGDLLAQVAWEGAPLDPERMPAGDFLSLL